MQDTHVQQETATQLLMAHRACLYGYIFACLRKHSDAEDVFQEVSLTVVKLADKLPAAEEFMPWAREIARRRVLAHLRKSKREVELSAEMVSKLAAAADSLDETGQLADRREALQKCLEKLPQRHKELITIHYTGDYSVTDLSLKIGRTMSATYGLLKRIRQKLRRCVEVQLECG